MWKHMCNMYNHMICMYHHNEANICSCNNISAFITHFMRSSVYTNQGQYSVAGLAMLPALCNAELLHYVYLLTNPVYVR